jgi:hypothetical protein
MKRLHIADLGMKPGPMLERGMPGMCSELSQ